MAARPLFGSPSFRLVAKGLVALHRLIQEGRDDSTEAESIRDALDQPLKALSRVEKERAQWLSEDLYSVSEPSATTAPKEMNPQAQQKLIEAYEARQGREWDRALALLRRWREYIAPALLNYLRGSIWLEAGHPDIASVFYGQAYESDPANAGYHAVYLHSLAESEPQTAGKLAREVLADDEKYAPFVVALAAKIRFDEAKDVSPAESAQLYRDLIPVLERNIKKIEADEDAASRDSAYAMTVSLLSLCHEFLGNAVAAMHYYTLGLQLNPNNDALLVARGMLQYGSSPRAVTDFEQAVRLGSPIVWPYLFLAHHYSITRQFERCRVMCETGLRMRGSDTAKSRLQEWLAIAEAELGFPPEMVRAAFEAAIRFDPSNELARRNHDAFEASLRIPHTSPASKWEPRLEAAVRQFGLVERRAAGQLSELIGPRRVA